MDDPVFAKLFDTPHGQLLAYLDTGDETDLLIRIVGAPVRGTSPSSNLGYDDETARLDGFAKIDQEGAEKIAAALHNFADKLAA